MPVRANKFGSHGNAIAQSRSQAMAATKALADRQDQAAVWAGVPETQQWACACGMINPARRTKCRSCEEKRK